MKTCFLFHFALSFKTVAHILLLAPFQISVCWQTDFRVNYVNKKHPIFNIKPANQSSSPSISNNLLTAPKTFPEKKATFNKVHFPRNQNHKTRAAHKATADNDTEVYWYLKYKGWFSVVGYTKTDRSLTLSLNYRAYMNQVLDLQPQIHHKIRNTLHTLVCKIMHIIKMYSSCIHSFLRQAK